MINDFQKECLLLKKQFVDKISRAIMFDCGQVASVRYEAWVSEKDSEPQEFVIITFYGGAISVRNVHMNSHSAILREIGRLVDGGYYEEVKYYNSLHKNKDWKLLF